MLKTRIVPTLLMKEFGLVKGISFDKSRRVGPVLPAFKLYNSRDVDELLLLDTSATSRGSIKFDLIANLSRFCKVPFSVGGGINCFSDASQLIRGGADKIVLNTILYESTDLISDISSTYGVQSVIASIDVTGDTPSTWECLSHSGTIPTGQHPVVWAKRLEEAGAGEILLTSIDRDGTMAGYDVALTKAVSSSVSIPVIASGGAGSYADMFDVISCSSVSAVSAASIFHFTDQTPAQAQTYLSKKGIKIRKNFPNEPS